MSGTIYHYALSRLPCRIARGIPLRGALPAEIILA